MLRFSLIATSGLLALAACGDRGPGTIRIDCGATDVIIEQDQAQALLAGSGASAQETAVAVCNTFRNVDASAYTEPTNVTVRTPNGAEVSGQVQASQQ